MFSMYIFPSYLIKQLKCLLYYQKCIYKYILLIGNDIPTLQEIKTWLGKCFSMKDLGETSYILGIIIYRDRSQRLLDLSQGTYIDKVLRRFNMNDSKKGFIPMSSCINLSKTLNPLILMKKQIECVMFHMLQQLGPSCML